MSGFVDIHSHVLPGIDDGPKTLEDSIAMAEAAAASGTAVLAATPHMNRHVRVEELAERCEAFRRELQEREIPLQIVSGGEMSAEWLLDASDQQIELASYGQRGTDVLIEMPPTSVRLIETVFPRLRAKGYRVTLAHPERGVALGHDRDWLRLLVDQGLVLAVNAEALLSSRANPRARTARLLCEEGLARVLASDGHRAAGSRPITHLAEAAAPLAELVGAERAAWMTRDAPRAIVEGQPLPVAPPVARRRGWLGLTRR